MELHPLLADAAGDVAGRFDLRAYDAVHLASAMVVDDGSIVVVTWDRALASAAGLGAAPLYEAVVVWERRRTLKGMRSPSN